MDNVIIFAGTTEGYALSRFLSASGIKVYACVATEYGGKSLEEGENLTVSCRRLDPEEMEERIRTLKPRMVLDATHPYAAVVTQNIQAVCEKLGVERIRVLRESGEKNGEAVYVDSVQEAAAFLNTVEGNVLLTTGSKELAAFTAVENYRERLFARVLSLPSVLDTCRALGFEGRNLIGMQGPFSEELNAAMLRQYDCRYLVTKDTGKAGGFQEKIDAAVKNGVIPVIIGRPLKEEGLSLMECKRLLIRNFDLKRRPSVTLLGIGMGAEGSLTVEGRRAAREADCVIGARRLADAVSFSDAEIFYEYMPDKIAEIVRNHPEYDRVVAALSGDVGFYSGAKKLIDALKADGYVLGEDLQILCGISSLSYFMGRIGLSYDDALIVSSHGRKANLPLQIRTHEKVFSILGTGDAVAALAGELCELGMEEVLLYVGENLSYPDEKIFCRKACELTAYQGTYLSVVCAVNPGAAASCTTHGFADEAFIRGKAPMTKEEVRAISLAKLRLTAESICVDVGAGTGSVSVEMALRCPFGTVYAVEKKEDAYGLIWENRKKFGVSNLVPVYGEAPSALESLPAPTHAFIGGSSGNLKQIVQLLLQKNPSVRIVINCITLETVSEALDTIKSFQLEADIVQLSASRSRSIGRYHMMMGENPIYVITVSAGEEKA